jgi:signal transduction histidine kinase
MMGALDVIESQPGTEAAARAAGRIRRACHDMVGFVDATLFLSREAALPRDAELSIDLAEVATTLAEDHAEAFASAGITLELDVRPMCLRGVPASLLQIAVGNLLKNVVQHSGGRRARLCLHGRQLCVTDDGRGIEHADLPHVFERSFTTGREGNGMGLSLLQRIADRFGWQLSLHSEPGTGTRVCIDFGSAER